MRYIWAPWRMTYIKGEVEEDGCLFCNRLKQKDGPDNLVLHRGRQAYVILNRYPYTNGHVMVVPFEHKPSIEDLSHETLSELMELTSQALRALREQYDAQNFNIGINIGESAGAGVVDHVHIHIVPRWSGDTNFMTTTATTRVLPESLEETYECLRRYWRKDPATNP
jgi:ATP adenylyltransferase